MPFTETNIAEDKTAAKEFSELGASQVPVVVVGDNVFKSFDKAEIEKALE